MKTSGIVLTLVLMLSGTVASADVVDMRAYSIKRGFRAYHAKKSTGHRSVVHKTTAASPKTGAPQQNKTEMPQPNKTEQSPESAQSKEKQHTEMQKYIDENPQVLPDI